MVTAPDEPKTNHKRPSSILIWVTAAIVAAGLIWLLVWLFYLQYHEFTDDANANGNLTNVNPAVSGNVISFFAQDTDLVIEGQLLVVLDPTYYQLAYERELDTLAATVLQVLQLYDEVKVNRANVESKKTALSRAQFDFENRNQLVGARAVSKEDFTHSRDTLSIARLDLEQAEAQLKSAIDAAGTTEPEQHPLLEKQKSAVRLSYYNLQHCRIYAPKTGYVAKRNVGVGQWVTPATNLMAIIPEPGMWVDANFKETQLTYMRVGQPATVWFDLYGSRVKHQGKVLGIALGSGSVFSIIPPQNATGNWIKIVQRLPVRITLDPDLLQKYPARLGISAQVDVDITNQDLPRMVNVISTHPIAETNVFKLDLSKVEEIIKNIIKQHMRHD